jgi:hypothetical protein
LCSEIILRPYQFCNLTEVVVRGWDTPTSLKRKVELASYLGTFQATLTNFTYLREVSRYCFWVVAHIIIVFIIVVIISPPCLAACRRSSVIAVFGPALGFSC